MGEILEDGDIYFLHRPKVDEEEAEPVDEVRRLLVQVADVSSTGRAGLCGG